LRKSKKNAYAFISAADTDSSWFPVAALGKTALLPFAAALGARIRIPAGAF
jgi:hypothetical protein